LDWFSVLSATIEIVDRSYGHENKMRSFLDYRTYLLKFKYYFFILVFVDRKRTYGTYVLAEIIDNLRMNHEPIKPLHPTRDVTYSLEEKPTL